MTYLDTLGQPRRVDPDKTANQWPAKPAEPLHTTQPGAYERGTSKRPTAAPVVDGDAKLVALDVSAHLRPLLRQVIHTLRYDQQLRISINGATRSTYDLYRDEDHRLGDLVDAIAKTPEARIILDDTQALDLSEQLDSAAAYEPPMCRRCENYAAHDTTEWCERHDPQAAS